MRQIFSCRSNTDELLKQIADLIAPYIVLWRHSMSKDYFLLYLSTVIFYRCVIVFVYSAILDSLMSVYLSVGRWPALLGYCPFWQPAIFFVWLFVKLNLENKVWFDLIWYIGRFSAGHFPVVFKAAFITPVLKKLGLDNTNVSSYRPISNLSVLSKLSERLVVRRLIWYLSSSDLPSL